jgi:hypothetical protein
MATLELQNVRYDVPYCIPFGTQTGALQLRLKAGGFEGGTPGSVDSPNAWIDHPDGLIDFDVFDGNPDDDGKLIATVQAKGEIERTVEVEKRAFLVIRSPHSYVIWVPIEGTTEAASK